MKLSLKHKKKNVYHLFEPMDESSRHMLTACAPRRPPKYFSLLQLKHFQDAGIELEIFDMPEETSDEIIKFLGGVSEIHYIKRDKKP